MSQISVDEKKLKLLLRETLTEAVEDIAMTNAIKEGELTGSASKNEVFRVLEGKI